MFKLRRAPPIHADVRRRFHFDLARRLLAKLEALDRDIRLGACSDSSGATQGDFNSRRLWLFRAAYHTTFVAPQSVSTETEPNARDIATIITQIKKEKIRAVFLENVSDPRLMRQIATETGATVGGTLYSDSLPEKNGAASNYINRVKHSTSTIASALAK